MIRTLIAFTVLAAPPQILQAETKLANPAASYCVESGGEYVIRKSAAGQTGFCKMPDGVEQDAWQMFRDAHVEKVTLANPAAVFCVDSGGTYDANTGNCLLPDGREVNGWDYFRAEHAGK